MKNFKWILRYAVSLFVITLLLMSMSVDHLFLPVFAEDRIDIKPMKYPVPLESEPNILGKIFSMYGLITTISILIIGLIICVKSKNSKK